MSRLTKLELTDDERLALETGYKLGKTHGFRQRCQMILLKAQKKTSKHIGQPLGCCLVTVNFWVKRYRADGIAGLHIKQGRGRAALLSQADLPAVREAIAANRQRLSLAQQALQDQLGKQFSHSTLKRFLKKTVADPGEFASE